jgi:alanine racemase
LANSAGVMLGPDYHFDLTRPGLALYGGVARAEMAACITPVVAIEASVLQVRAIGADCPVGYNATYRTNAPTRIATAAIGYADGYWRGFSGKSVAKFGDVEMPVLGRVSMDLITIDATLQLMLNESDWVNVDYNLTRAAKIAGKSEYELLTGLGCRAERNWF